MKSKIGDTILILASLLFVLGAIGVLINSLPQSTLQAMSALALIFVGAGINLKKMVKK
ncbi:hypothetical protein ES704_00294 [subsurface metagenome]|jgi:NADH:ubiquinone oxidoreductase subunit K